MIWAIQFAEFEAHLASLGYREAAHFEDVIIYSNGVRQFSATVPIGARDLMIEILAADILDNAGLPVPAQWQTYQWRD